jgi:hypothetical protein
MLVIYGDWCGLGEVGILPFYTSFEGYSTLTVGRVSSFIDLMLTKRDKMAAEPALSLVPDARAPPKGCCPTTAPVAHTR